MELITQTSSQHDSENRMRRKRSGQHSGWRTARAQETGQALVNREAAVGSCRVGKGVLGGPAGEVGHLGEPCGWAALGWEGLSPGHTRAAAASAPSGSSTSVMDETLIKVMRCL